MVKLQPLASTKQPIIVHIDMNSYFATCEQQDNPALRGKPVGVCEHLGGIIIAPSIEAKRWGVKTAMPVWEAKKLYPKIILIPTNPDRYRFYTDRFLKVFYDYTDRIEKYSIDEAFLDLTKSCNIKIKKHGQWIPANPWEEAQRIVLEIKRRMITEVGDWITCSAGISYSKLLAKIASDLQKPNGLVVVTPADKSKLYKRLQLDDIPGIGARMKNNLAELGIDTLEQLRDYPLSRLVAMYGIQGYHIHCMGQLDGSWKEAFDPEEQEDMKSIGHMYTIPQKYRSSQYFLPVLYKISEMVAKRLRANHLSGNGLRIYVRDPINGSTSKSITLGYYLDEGADIYRESVSLLQGIKNLNVLQQSPYLIGVTVFGLTEAVAQKSLFDDKLKTRSRLAQALDQINEKYDDFTIARVPAFLARDILRDSIGFGRIKEFKTTFLK